MRILLVGSSFSRGVKDPLQLLISSSGRTATIGVRAVDRWALQNHASSPETLSQIALGWDYVVLQEQSDGFYSARYPYARILNTKIRAMGGRTAFMMTWRDRTDVLSYYDSLKGVVGGKTGYVPIAFELGAPIAPTGWVYRQCVAENTGINLWNSDGHHANNRGNYINAMCIYSAIYKASPVGLKTPAPNVWAPYKDHDQQLVNTVAMVNRSTWNI